MTLALFPLTKETVPHQTITIKLFYLELIFFFFPQLLFQQPKFSVTEWGTSATK